MILKKHLRNTCKETRIVNGPITKIHLNYLSVCYCFYQLVVISILFRSATWFRVKQRHAWLVLRWVTILVYVNSLLDETWIVSLMRL